MRISGGAVPAREVEEHLFGWVAASASHQTDGPAEEEPFGDLSDEPTQRDTVGAGWMLLVEDRALFRQSLALLLEWRTGLECERAGSLAEARRTLDEVDDAPAAAIVDLDLPEAVELIERLQGRPVLALTTGASLGRCVQALEAGADRVLSTASPVEEIVATVQQFVGG